MIVKFPANKTKTTGNHKTVSMPERVNGYHKWPFCFLCVEFLMARTGSRCFRQGGCSCTPHLNFVHPPSDESKPPPKPKAEPPRRSRREMEPKLDSAMFRASNIVDYDHACDSEKEACQALMKAVQELFDSLFPEAGPRVDPYKLKYDEVIRKTSELVRYHQVSDRGKEASRLLAEAVHELFDSEFPKAKAEAAEAEAGPAEPDLYNCTPHPLEEAESDSDSDSDDPDVDRDGRPAFENVTGNPGKRRRVSNE